MCGIIAVFSECPELEYILKGYKTLKKRGPDNGSLELYKEGVLGFQRLSIVDLSVDGNQPMLSKDSGARLVCNGEIYNYKELIEEYNLKCQSGSDCEVILKLYEKVGFRKMVLLLDGVFAIAIIDGDNFHIARDRIGVRPMYIGMSNGSIAIASTVRALSGLCKNTISQFYGIGSYNRVSKTWKQSCHNPFPIPKYVVKNFNHYTKPIRECLINAVRKRIPEYVKYGIFLSGGLDSSLMASIIVRLVGSENIRTYSTGLEGSTDLKFARIVADYLGTKHTEVIFKLEECLEAIPNVIEDLATYDITTIRASVFMWLLSKWISENTDEKVIISGEGSDEILQGYLYFHHAPSFKEGSAESRRLINELSMYDVLRADSCVSSHGLELRVPFLDFDFVNLVLSLPIQTVAPTDGIEKFILRKAFQGYLPNSILWRRKEGMSDGVSSLEKSWFESIKDFVASLKQSDSDLFPSQESFYYYNLFKSAYPEYNLKINYWMPKWTGSSDPSGRMISIPSIPC